MICTTCLGSLARLPCDAIHTGKVALVLCGNGKEGSERSAKMTCAERWQLLYHNSGYSSQLGS